MAHLQKFTRGSVRAILEHDTRTANHAYKNPDIDPIRTRIGKMLMSCVLG